MKKFFLGAAILVFLASFSMSAQDKKDVKTGKTEKTTVVTSELNTVCPVSKEEADPKITANYNGKTYALCCKTCLKKFQKDPEKYIQKMNQKKDNK